MSDPFALFAYVNILGGYTWVTANGAEMPSPLSKLMQNCIRETGERQEDGWFTIDMGERTCHVICAYDRNGADETGRSGITTLLGLTGDSDLAESQSQRQRLSAYVAGELTRLRASLVAAKVPRDLAILAVRGHINGAVPAPTGSKAGNAPQAGRVDQSYVLLDTAKQWERLVALALLAGLVLNSILLTVVVLGLSIR